LKKNKKKRMRKPSSHLGQGGVPLNLKLSLCMIVKDEAKNLGDCIHPVKPVVDEIIVVDTGSTDGTQEIARELGAKVFNFPWCDDFSAARNESIRQATGDYIMWLDADDRVDETEVRKIELLKKSFPRKRDEAYDAIVTSHSPIEGTTHFYQMRIFPRVERGLFEGRIHEQVVYNLQRLGVQRIPTEIRIRHSGYVDLKTIQQKSERNLNILRKELETNPENLLLHFYTGRTLAGMGRQMEAVFHMRRITSDERIRRDEKAFYLEASLLLGKYYVELKLYDEALTLFRHLSEEDPENGLVHFSLGEALFQVRDYPGAIEALRRSLLYPIEVSHLPVNIERLHYHQHHTLARCYLETGEGLLAIDVLLKFLGRYPDHSQTLKTLGLLSLEHQRFEGAGEYYERAIQRGEGSDEDYANLGLAYRKLGRFDEAERNWNRALQINPQRIEACINLGHLHHQQKDYPKALERFKEALDIDSNLMDVRLALSGIYFRFHDLENLVRECDALMEELNLPRDITLNGYDELSDLYERIKEVLSDQGRPELSLMAYHTSFMIHPSGDVLDKIISQAGISGGLERSMEKIKDVLGFHQIGPSVSLFEKS